MKLFQTGFFHLQDAFKFPPCLLWLDSSFSLHFFLISLNNIPMSGYTSLFSIHLMKIILVTSSLGPIMDKAAINICVQAFVWVGIAGCYSKSVVTFVRNCRTVSQSCCILQSYQNSYCLLLCTALAFLLML